MHDDTITTDAHMREMNDTDDYPEEAYLRKTVFYVLIDNVVSGLTMRYNAVRKFAEKFDFFAEISNNVGSELEEITKR